MCRRIRPTGTGTRSGSCACGEHLYGDVKTIGIVVGIHKHKYNVKENEETLTEITSNKVVFYVKQIQTWFIKSIREFMSILGFLVKSICSGEGF